MIKNGGILIEEKIAFEIPHLEKVKNLTIANIKKYEHILLEKILRLYVLSSTFLKTKYQEIKIEVKNRIKARHINGEKKEISKFLKIVGDYKHKIREIKHKIKKEENL